MAGNLEHAEDLINVVQQPIHHEDIDVSNEVVDHDGNLTTDQTDQLLHFQDLTGINDINRCRQMLLKHNWNMEAAVQAQFIDPVERRQPRLPSVDTRMPIINTHPLDQRVYAIIHRRPIGIMGWGYWIVTFPFHYFYSRIISLFRFAFRLLWRNPRKAITNPLDDVTHFRQQFISKYGDLHPDFIEGTYCQAVNMARRDLRFLLVYLHRPERKETEAFCRNVICSNPVVEFCNSMFLVWGCDADSAEGQRALQSMAERSSNLIVAILVQRHNRLTVVAKIEDFCDAVQCLERLRQILHDNQHYVQAAEMEREELNLTHSLRQEQDEAYHLSLKADQEKELARRLECEHREQLDKRAKEEEQRQVEELLQRKSESRDRLVFEPDEDDPDAIKIMLKLPNGMRLDRRFHKKDSVRALHDFLFVHEASPDNFRIVHDFPRRVLLCKPSEYESESSMPTFEAVGLGRSELLFVQDEDA